MFLGVQLGTAEAAQCMKHGWIMDGEGQPCVREQLSLTAENHSHPGHVASLAAQFFLLFEIW